MVKGLDIFRERLGKFAESMTFIGGAACDEWFAAMGLEFRTTKDLDIVLLIEVIAPEMIKALRIFINEGGYQIRQRTEGVPVLFRFAQPTNERFPLELEFFCRKPDGLFLGEAQNIIPLLVGADHHSLSAILLNDDYYALIQTHKIVSNGLAFANATALIPLKAHAWLDLTNRKRSGEVIDTQKITKHRNDIFRLAATLPQTKGPKLPDVITSDLVRFLNSFSTSSSEWESILNALKGTLGGKVLPEVLHASIQNYFGLPKE